uniref:Maturation protein n=1 Tax=Wenzhou levi-like virus 6 TaxID=1923572 RepID=A0A1L3KIR9_9VIRU|nr:hypothetical protein [Wenzhou levi-like virus 6]
MRVRTSGGIETVTLNQALAPAEHSTVSNFRVNAHKNATLNMLGVEIFVGDLCYGAPNYRFRSGSLGTIMNRINEVFDAVSAAYYSKLDFEGKEQTFVVLDKSQVTRDVVTKGFAALRRKGAIINNPMSSQRVEASSTIVGGTEGSTWTPLPTQRVDGTFPGRGRYQLSVTVQWHAKLSVPAEYGVGLTEGAWKQMLLAFGNNEPMPDYQSAVNDAFANQDSADVELLVAAAEAKSTLDSFAVMGLRIAKIQRSIRRGKFHKLAPKTWKRYLRDKKVNPVSISDYFLDAWMEVRYAWRPLIADANGALKFFNGSNSLAKRMTFRGSSFDEGSSNGSFFFEDNGYHYQVEYNSHYTHHVRAGVIGHARFDLNKSHKLGLFNVATAAWDLVPYSFVADWFVNTSGVLHSLNPNPIYESLASWATRRVEHTVLADVTVTPPSGTAKKLSVSVLLTRKDRIPNVGRSYITFDLNLNRYKLVDSVAMLRRWM